MMQQHRHFWQTKRRLTSQAARLVLLGGAVLLAMLVVAGWGSARAAPESGAPSLSIVSIAGNNLTLQFDGWTPGQTITLGYSANPNCSSPLPLPNATFPVTGSSFQTNYTWPGSGIQPGTYHLCASDPVDGTFASQQTITITSAGGVQPTPGTPTGSTPTSTASAGASPSATAGASGTPGATGTPGNQGTSTNASNNGDNTLIAIILLCVLVMALLAYLIRLWLQGRQSGGQQNP